MIYTDYYLQRFHKLLNLALLIIWLERDWNTCLIITPSKIEIMSSVLLTDMYFESFELLKQFPYYLKMKLGLEASNLIVEFLVDS